MFDVAIVGGGVAGLMAARRLPKTFSFVLIDKKREIGRPLKCGEGIRGDGFIRLFGHGNYGFIRNRVGEHEVRYRGARRRFKVDYLQLDREKFEGFLAKPIKDKIRLNTNCRSIVIKKDYAEVLTNKGVIKAKLVILAYGCNFNIQRKYNLIKKNPVLLFCCGGIYGNCNLDRRRFYAYFDDKYLGYLWIFPKGKGIANIGFGTLAKTNVKGVLEDKLKEMNLKKISEYAGVVPCSGPIWRTYSDRLLVCGDSAGFVYAGTGEGIYFALESGRLAAETAIEAVKSNRFDRKFLKRYEKKWKKSFGRLMKAGIVFFDLQELAYKWKRMKALFTIPTNKEIEGMIIEGKVSLRAKLVWWVYRLLKGTFLK